MLIKIKAHCFTVMLLSLNDSMLWLRFYDPNTLVQQGVALFSEFMEREENEMTCVVYKLMQFSLTTEQLKF